MSRDREKAEEVWQKLKQAIREEEFREILSLTGEYLIVHKYVEHPDVLVPAVQKAARELSKDPDADLREICRVLRWVADGVVNTGEERVGNLYRLAIEIARNIDGPEKYIEEARTMYEMTDYDYLNGEGERAEQRLNDALDLVVELESEEARQLAGLILRKLVFDDTVY